MAFDDENQNQNDFEKMTGQGPGEPLQERPSSYYIQPPEPKYYRGKRKNSIFTIILVAVVSSMIGGILAGYLAPVYLYGKYIPYPELKQGPVPQNIEIITKAEDLGVVPAVVKKAMPAVVGITTVTVQRDFFFGTRRGQGIGTGVIIDNRGYILTNSHVVNDGRTEEVRVLLYDGRDLKADVLWNDPLLDLAVVKVQAQNLPVAALGDSDKLQVGELAIAIGNPLGLSFERTVTAGIISGLNRSIPISEFENIEGLIQTDASINPGNSGGPLLNAKGEVIGINTAKIQTGEGLGFAIPINIAKPIVDEFAEKGEFRKAYLGIRGVDVQQYIVNYGNNLGVDYGVFVYEVTPNSPVYKAGIQEGDVIIAVDNHKINSMSKLVKLLYQYRPGETVKIDVVRNRKKMSLEVTLAAMPRG